MADPDWPGAPLWRWSWDHLVHGFVELGELTSTGLCGHVASTTTLQEPAESIRRCVACLLIHGQQLDDKTAERGDWRSQ